MTVHRDYANKSCPGDYLYNRHGEIAAEVNKRLGVKSSNKYSYDDTVNAMIEDGVTDVKNMANWEKMLDGREKLNAEYVRAVLDRYHEKVGTC